MRFLIILIAFSSSVSMAAVQDFNGLVAEATQQEKRIRRKLLQAIQNTQVAIAYNDRIEKIQSSRDVGLDSLQVRLVSAE